MGEELVVDWGQEQAQAVGDVLEHEQGPEPEIDTEMEQRLSQEFEGLPSETGFPATDLISYLFLKVLLLLFKKKMSRWVGVWGCHPMSAGSMSGQLIH